jgi:hypothetical protein
MAAPPTASLPRSTSPAAPRFPTVALVWMAIGLASWLAFMLAPSGRALVGGFATAVVTIPFLGLGRTPLRWFHPLILVAVPAIIGLGLRSWYLLYAGNRPGAADLLIGTDPINTVVLGTAVLGAGLGALVFGFVALHPTRAPSPAARPLWGDWQMPWRWTNVFLIGCLALGALATLLYFRAIGGVSLDTLSSKRYVQLDSGGVSSGAFVSRAAAVPAFAALPIIAMRARGAKVPRFTQGLVVLCLLCSMAAPFVSSARSEIIAMLVIVGITWSCRHTTFSLRVALLGGIVLFILLAMGSLRCEHQTGSSAGCSVPNQIEGSLLANENWMSVTKTAHIARKVPDVVDFQYGRTFVSALVAPVPRVIWPDKPIVRSDILVGFEILELPSVRRTGAPPGIVGEFFLNLGWVGVVAGMVGLGWFLRRLWDWHQRNQSDFAVAVFAIIATHIALRLPGGDFVGSFLPAMQGLTILLFLTIAGSLFRKRTRPTT